MASILATAERLGMTVVGEPHAMKARTVPPSAPAEGEAPREEPVAAARRAV
jgi:hypothetical protein